MAKSTTKKVTKESKQKVEEKAAATSESSSSDSSSSSSSSSSSESESSSSDSSSSESESSSDSSSSESESSSSDDESSSEAEEESKKGEKKEESSSSESESESESEESKKEESKSESSSDSSSSSSSESESSDEEEEEKKEESKKRKAEESEESESKKSKTEGEPATIFVGRLSWSIDDEWLKNEFEHIGGVIGARVIYERGTDRSRGYGYVDFENKEYAEKAVKEMHGKEIDGREINCDMSTSKPAAGNNDRAKKFGDVPSEPSETLFLGNLSFNADRDNISEMFSKFGEIVSVRIPTHPETEQPKGFGYVQYTNVEDAKKALDALQGEYIDNRPVRLDFSTPRPPQNNSGFRGGRDGFRGGRGGNRGGRDGFRGGRGGNRGGFRSGSGANNAPLGQSRNTASFSGTKKTFD
ncbi:hypothetical protein KAFR_0F03120 [Kazachstania africana CBS 2517]|uniref:RRM domain-containing protein n=1 Tax=Kazachstania africana (strain ATCC 22294 / BCRC 22015 / CBS 2517 / CECT 1963 / NBRC 1671 / NRRL Y-8276) TaxID=1071382 RepID=H2AX08_KAZAF|nr:hypothetical protein KAFR_0F03120 [Kazachstania africana CBS 2517]CCF58908.1 hypothetical protein KAFR_0F03120 [Kazachstania africana CBS 2517]